MILHLLKFKAHVYTIWLHGAFLNDQMHPTTWDMYHILIQSQSGIGTIRGMYIKQSLWDGLQPRLSRGGRRQAVELAADVDDGGQLTGFEFKVLASVRGSKYPKFRGIRPQILSCNAHETYWVFSALLGAEGKGNRHAFKAHVHVISTVWGFRLQV